MRAIRHIIRGCGTVPGYGSHPGTAALALFVVMGAIAGLQRGAAGAVFGGSAMLAAFGPPYLWGAYDRSRSAERRTTPTPRDNAGQPDSGRDGE